MSIIQGYRGICNMDGITIPALPGSSVAMPKNYNLPPICCGGNAFQGMAVEGLQFPVFNFVLLPTADWFTAAIINGWITKSSDDAPAQSACGLFDGYSGLTASASKHASFNMSVSQGELVRTSTQFWGQGTITTGITTAASFSAAAFPASPNTPVSWAQTGHASTAAAALDGLISWDLSWSNNLMPNPTLPAAGNVTPTFYPTESNAGMYTARIRLVFQADVPAPADGGDFTLTVRMPASSPYTVSFKCWNPILVDNSSRSIQLPRSLREYNYILRGKYSDGATDLALPITIS